MNCKYFIPRYRRSDEESSLFSVDSFKNRYHLARNSLIDSDWSTSSSSSDDSFLVHTNISSITEYGDEMDHHQKLYYGEGDHDAADLNSSFSSSKRRPYNWSRFHTHYHGLHHATTIPPEVALLHRQTISILDSANDAESPSNHMISPIKDRFYYEMRNDAVHDKLCNDGCSDYDGYSDDDASETSLMTDDDGMRSEVKRLKYVVQAIRRDINMDLDLDLDLDGQIMTYHYENLIYTQERNQDDEKLKDEPNNYVVFGRRVVMVFLLGTIFSLSNNMGLLLHGKDEYDLLTSISETRHIKSTKPRIENDFSTSCRNDLLEVDLCAIDKRFLTLI